MPEILEKTDVVIEQLNEKIAVLENSLTGMEQRRERSASAVVTDGGQVRSTFANEVASRDIEIQAVKKRIQELTEDRRAAIEDLPRREELRAKAVKLEQDPREKEKAAVNLQERLRNLEEEIEEIKDEVNSTLVKANHSLKELEASVKNLEEVRRLNREDRLVAANAGLREAQLNLARAEKFGGVEEKDLEFLRKRVAIYQRQVDGLKEN